MFTKADRVLAELAAEQDGIVTWDDMLSSGLTVKQATHRIPHYTVLHRGVFLVPGAPLTPRSRIRAACKAGAPNAAASHRSGAAMLSLPGGRQDLAEVSCPRWLRTRHWGLIVHESNRIDPRDVREVDGIPVMRPERILIELASIYRSPDFIEVVLHAMLRKKLATIASTTA